MRAAVRWLAAAAVAVSACGGGRAKPDGGGGGTDGGGVDIAVGPGGAGGGLTDAGAADLPRSTGTFPYAGRWWALLTRVLPDDGGIGDSRPFVIHWSETDPADRLLWTSINVVPMTVSSGPDGSTIVQHAAQGTNGCWAIYATSDPDALDVRACSTPQSSSAPLLGTFRRGARLVAQIPKSPLPAPDGYLPDVKVAGSDIGAGGDRVMFSVGPRLWLWKRDTDQAFDVGPGNALGARLSSDGRRAMYSRSTVGAQVNMLLAFDSASGETTDLTTLVPIKPTAQYGSGGIFSPDGSKAALRVNIPISGTGDLIVYDFGTKKTTMVAPGVNASAVGSLKDVFLASGDHLIYVGYDGGLAPPSGTATLIGYELSTDKQVSFGQAADLVEFPGKKLAGFQTAADGLVLVDDATFTPRVIATLSSGGQYIGGGGLVPSPDGTEVAYTDPQGVLNVRNVASGATTAVASGVGCFAVPNPLSFPGSGQTRAIAALFAADGALVYNVAPGCGSGGFYGIGRYDRAARTEKVYTAVGNGTSTLAMSPYGGIVIDPGPLPTVLAWPGPPVVVDAVVPSVLDPQDPPFVFSAADRYLTCTGNGFLMVLDNQSGTVAKPTVTGGLDSKTFTSPVSGVSVPYTYGATLNAYLPDGTSWQVGTRATGILATAARTKVVYTADGGIYGLSLEPGAKPTLIGNGFPVVVTDTQVLFQDLDGICAAAL